jgi:Tfp pilus assembly protein PilV
LTYRGPSTTDGFTVVEVVVAITVLVIALVGAAALFQNGIVVSGNTRNRVVAAQLASEALERTRGTAADPTKFTSITIGQTVTTRTVNGLKFTVTQDVQFVGQRSTQSSCDSPGSHDGQIMQVTAKVTWPAMAGTKPVQSTTTLSPPVGAYSASTGSVAIKVFNASGAVSQNINVKVQGPLTQTQQTTSEGCAFFPFLTPGTYAVSIIEGTGVGDQENVTPTQNTSVSVGQTASLMFNYDTAATINVTGWSNSVAPPATGLRLSVANLGLQPYSQFSFATGITSLVPLYPYANGYHVFAGNCTDNNPIGKDTNRNLFYPTLTATPIGVTSGAPTDTTVPLYTLPVIVKNGAAVPVANAAVSAATTTSFAAPYTAVCTSGTGTGTPSTLGLVTSDAAGNSVTAVPLGHWTITATSGALTGSAKVWVQPDGVYAVDASGAATTLYSTPVTVVVS